MATRFQAVLVTIGLIALSLLGFWWAGNPRVAPPRDGRTEISAYMIITPLRDLYEAQVAAFEQANPQIRVRIHWVPGSEYNVKLKLLAATGKLPDLFLSGDVWVSYLRPYSRDITDLVQRDAAEFGLDDYFPEVRRAMQLDGKYYILPEHMNLSLLYFNRRLFRDAGLPEPDAQWTWEDMMKAGQALTRPGTVDRPGVWGCSRVEGWWGEWLIYVRQAGGDIFTPDGRRCSLDSPAAIAGLRFYLEKSTRYGVSAATGFEPVNGFVNERVAMVFGGHVSSWVLYEQMPGLDWDVQMLPQGPVTRTGGELTIAGYSLSRTSRHPEQAWAFAKFLTRPEAIAAIAKRSSLSVRRSVADQTIGARGPRARPKNLEAAYRQFAFGQRIPLQENFIEVMILIVQPEIDRMLQGAHTPEEAGRRAAEAVNMYLATFNPGVTP